MSVPAVTSSGAATWTSGSPLGFEARRTEQRLLVDGRVGGGESPRFVGDITPVEVGTTGEKAVVLGEKGRQRVGLRDGRLAVDALVREVETGARFARVVPFAPQSEAVAVAVDVHPRAVVRERVQRPRNRHREAVVGVEAEEVHARRSVSRDVGPEVHLGEAPPYRRAARPDVLHHERDDAEPRVPVVGRYLDTVGEVSSHDGRVGPPVCEHPVAPAHREQVRVHIGATGAAYFWVPRRLVDVGKHKRYNRF